MGNFEEYPGGHADKIGEILIIDSPRWLRKAVEQKHARLTLALADSILLVYNDLDKKLLAFSNYN